MLRQHSLQKNNVCLKTTILEFAKELLSFLRVNHLLHYFDIFLTEVLSINKNNI